jgi:uncharacterized protein with GYD domain
MLCRCEPNNLVLILLQHQNFQFPLIARSSSYSPAQNCSQKTNDMATYISLLNWTDQGIRNVKDSLKRAGEARKAYQAAGGRIVDLYWTMGQHDLVVIAELPDDESAFRLLLTVGMQGNVRTTTMRALNEEEMTRVFKGIS